MIATTTAGTPATKSQKVTVRFDTRQYSTNHGAEPRGRGSWAFIDADQADAPNYLDDVYWVHGGTYGEAKKKAAAFFAPIAAARGMLTFYVAVLP